ncbi:ATP-binding protein, partial [Saccharopolyspora erythraea]|uniref:ATP-binding protein n=1 Tax=Saccharopolyspora erythraea TaxID=1836 RepID=UPI0004CEFBD4
MTGPAEPLIGQGDALAELEGLVREAGEHRCGFVVVSGAAGTGKSTLGRRLLARHEGPAWWATAAPWESRQPYGVVAQMLPDLDVGAGPVAVAERVADRLAASDGTTVAVVDDGHWADEESLQALASVVRHHPRARLLVVAFAVTGDPHASAATLELLPRIATAEIRLSPLTAAQVNELAAARGVVLHPSIAERLCHHTQGAARHIAQLLDEVPAATWTRFDPGLPAPRPSPRGCANCSRAARRPFGRSWRRPRCWARAQR